MDYKRVLLKLSGEALSGKTSIYDYEILKNILNQVKFLKSKNIQVGIVIGGGNIWRGEIAKTINIELEKADYMGMMATSINALALTSFFNKHGEKAIFINSLNFERISKNESPKIIDEYLNQNNIVVFGGGTGRPFFSTDTAASLRAKEIKADVIFIAKNNTNGVYDKDPNKHKDAKFYEKISFDEIIDNNLKVIDHSALNLLKGTGIDIIIFNMNSNKFLENLYNNNESKTIILEKVI